MTPVGAGEAGAAEGPMRKLQRSIPWVIACIVLLCAWSAGGAQSGPTVASVVLSPSTIAGGSGDASTGTVTLDGPAPAGGALVEVHTSNPGLAASRPTVLVAEGADSATFTVATNARYRRYSGLSFSATISAATNGSTQAATLTVTAQPMPADIQNDSTQRHGTVCGGSFPASSGEKGILYTCFDGPNPGTVGTCTFNAECLASGCQTEMSRNFSFTDACARSGPYPIALSPDLLESGSASQGTLSLDSAAPSGSDALVSSSNSQTTAFPTGFFPIPPGATAALFHVATSILPSVEFSSVGTSIEIPVPIKKGGIFLSHRLGLAWLAMTPPEPPPAQPVQTLGQLSVDSDPVTGGNNSIASVWLSAVSPSGGPTIALSSDNPQVASVPSSVTISAGSNVETVTITTAPVATTTTVTLTATEGSRSYSDTLTVVPQNCVPTTCAGQGFNCGSISDGRGLTVDCGTCIRHEMCVSNVCTRK